MRHLRCRGFWARLRRIGGLKPRRRSTGAAPMVATGVRGSLGTGFAGVQMRMIHICTGRGGKDALRENEKKALVELAKKDADNKN